jgi:osmotically-inducible protein OsmY
MLYPDADVALRVLRALRDRHFSTLRELDVSVHRSEATLTGEVNSFYEKQLAMSACQAVPGVLRLIDRIEVCESGNDRC